MKKGAFNLLSAVDSYARLNDLTKEQGLSFYQLGKKVNMPSSFFSEWKRGKMMPKADKLQILADYFGVPLDYFLKE